MHAGLKNLLKYALSASSAQPIFKYRQRCIRLGHFQRSLEVIQVIPERKWQGHTMSAGHSIVKFYIDLRNTDACGLLDGTCRNIGNILWISNQ